MERVVIRCLASQKENYAIFGARNMKTLKNMLHTVCVLCVCVLCTCLVSQPSGSIPLNS